MRDEGGSVRDEGGRRDEGMRVRDEGGRGDEGGEKG